MTREEQIKQALSKYIKDRGVSGNHIVDVERDAAFISGALYADRNPDLSSLWHSASEEPQADNVEILYISKSGCTDICIRSKGVFNYVAEWKGFVKQDYVAKWAYISDLLPKGGKK